MFSSGKKYELDWWPDESGDADPKNPYYKESVNEHFACCDHIKEDWSKVNKADKTDGLSQKAVDAYRRENPGSKLKTAVTKDPSKLKAGSKDAKRRLSFCRRMKGMKERLTKPENARDPDSAINKALRRWNC
jgi:protein involved in sex pheromone biosynthesis